MTLSDLHLVVRRSEHRDWVGSRRATTNSARSVTNVRTSLPFGDGAANVSGGQDNTFDGYTGLWGGGSSATNHAQFREYWNVAGRWLQPDPYSGSYDLTNPQSFSASDITSKGLVTPNNYSALVLETSPCHFIIFARPAHFMEKMKQ